MHFAALKKNQEMYNYLLENTKINEHEKHKNGVSAKDMIEKKSEKKIKTVEFSSSSASEDSAPDSPLKEFDENSEKRVLKIENLQLF